MQTSVQYSLQKLTFDNNGQNFMQNPACPILFDFLMFHLKFCH